MIRRPPRSTQSRSSAASDVYKRQSSTCSFPVPCRSRPWSGPVRPRSKFHIFRPVLNVSYCLSVATQKYEVFRRPPPGIWPCLLYTSDAADDLLCVDLGGRRIIKKKK